MAAESRQSVATAPEPDPDRDGDGGVAGVGVRGGVDGGCGGAIKRVGLVGQRTGRCWCWSWRYLMAELYARNCIAFSFNFCPSCRNAAGPSLAGWLPHAATATAAAVAIGRPPW